VIRRLAAWLLVVPMVAFGLGVYAYLGTLRSAKTLTAAASAPHATKPKFTLPGTMFLAQGGSLYRLNRGTFTQIGTPGGWSQPTLTPDNKQLIAVRRVRLSTDLYLLDLDGQVLRRLTQNESKWVDYNHWAFYPRVSPDGQSVFYSYDGPKYDYRIDFSIWSMPLGGSQSQARRQTTGYEWTGGDVSPVPLRSGGLLFVKYDFDEKGSYSQIYLRSRPGAAPKALTSVADDCSQPVISPDETQLAMLCTSRSDTARLRLASFNGSTLGPIEHLVDGQLCAAPAWSPDGDGLVYLSPIGSAGRFQLWWLPLASPGATSAPVPVPMTAGLDFDATSAPAWFQIPAKVRPFEPRGKL
jgi:Tol biopolymer transport system component